MRRENFFIRLRESMEVRTRNYFAALLETRNFEVLILYFIQFVSIVSLLLCHLKIYRVELSLTMLRVN